MTPAGTLAQIFSFEAAFESAFKTILEKVGIETVYITRQVAIQATPSVGVKVINGAVNERHQYNPLSGSAAIYDCFDASLEIEVRTNRGSEGQDHATLCGLVRGALLLYSLVRTFPPEGPTDFYQSITDIREQRGDTAFDSETNLDTTIIPYYLLINVRPDAWPSGM